MLLFWLLEIFLWTSRNYLNAAEAYMMDLRYEETSFELDLRCVCLDRLKRSAAVSNCYSNKWAYAAKGKLLLPPYIRDYFFHRCFFFYWGKVPVLYNDKFAILFIIGPTNLFGRGGGGGSINIFTYPYKISSNSKFQDCDSVQNKKTML